MQISVSHMNSRTGWYLILRKTITVLLVQQNSAKWSLLPFRTDFKTTFVLTTQDRKGVKNPSFCSCWSFQTLQSSHSNIQARSAVSGKDQGPTPAVKLCEALFLFIYFLSTYKNDLARDKIHLRTQEGICQRQLLQTEGPSIAACSHRSLQSTLHWTH